MKASNISKYVVITILLAPLAWAVLKYTELSRNHRYTISTTIGSEGGGWIGYSYSVNGTKYKGTKRSLKFSPQKNGGRYYVEFSTESPSTSKILWDKPVSAEIKQAPTDGWEEIP